MRGLAAGALAALTALACGGAPAPVVGEVTVTWAGASAADVEHQVLDPLERALGALDGTQRIEGMATEGRAVVRWTAQGDRDLLQQAVREALQGVQPQLPQDADHPLMSRPGTVTWWVSADEAASPAELTLRAEALRMRLLGQPGVLDVGISGGTETRIVVEADPTRLLACGLSGRDLERALSAPADVPAGALTFTDQALTLRAGGASGSLDTLGELVVVADPQVVRLQDVASVRREEHTPGPAHHQGYPAVFLAVKGDPGPVEAGWVDLGERRARWRSATPDPAEVLEAPGLVAEGPPDFACPTGRCAWEPAVEGCQTVVVKGPTPDPARDVAKALRAAGAEVVDDGTLAIETEWVVTVDRDRAADLGLSVADVADAMRYATGGKVVGAWREREQVFDLVLRVGPGENVLYEMQVARASSGQLVPLSQVISSREEAVPPVVWHEDRQRRVSLQVCGLVGDVEAIVGGVPVPEGVVVEVR